MANVQLPSINVTPGDIDKASLPELQKIVKILINTTAILTEELTFLLNNLDTRNVNELNAEVIIAGSITAEKIAANSITADKMDVNELSAISANLGHITAGLIEAVRIFGSYIATNMGYPRCEFNSNTNEIASISSPSQYISMKPSFGGNPLLAMTSNGYDASLVNDSGVTTLQSPLDLILRSEIGDISFQQGNFVRIDDFYYLYENFTGQSLQQKLDELSNRITALGG